MMMQAQILIPMVDNDGRRTPGWLLNNWLRYAVEHFGGCTLNRGAHGYWRGEERDYASEPVAILEVDFKHDDRKRWHVLDLAKQIKAALKQERVYVRFIPVNTVLV